MQSAVGWQPFSRSARGPSLLAQLGMKGWAAAQSKSGCGRKRCRKHGPGKVWNDAIRSFFRSKFKALKTPPSHGFWGFVAIETVAVAKKAFPAGGGRPGPLFRLLRFVQHHVPVAAGVQPQAAGGGVAQINDAVPGEGAPVVDADNDLFAVAGVAHQHAGAKGQAPVGGSERVHVKALAAGRAPALEVCAVPGGAALLQHAAGGLRGQRAVGASCRQQGQPQAAGGAEPGGESRAAREHGRRF